MRINRYLYEIIYLLNKTTSKWLKDTNDKIKAEGLDIISNNDDKNIVIQLAKAPAKYSKEDQQKIDELKASFTPINEDEKVQKIIIQHIGQSANDKVNKILATLQNNQDNKVIAKVASMLDNTIR